MQEKVSILVPVYNVESYLARCLDSLLHQTWLNTEIILINDGSTDKSLQIARHYAARHPNIRIYTYPNSGISATRNRALDHVRGDYVMFVDSDDYIEPDMIEKMMEEIHKHDLDLVQCGFVMDFGPVPFMRPGSGHHQFDKLEALKHLAKGRCLNNYPWGKLTKTRCFKDIRFPEDIPGFEDTYTIFKTIAAADRIGTMPQRFYHYVQRRGSLTNRMGLDTVYLMRQAYEYQNQYLHEVFPGEDFSFDLQYYNSDMVIIYTLILFSHKSDHPYFIPGDIHWKNLPASPVLYGAYQAWLGIARLKLSDKILAKPENHTKD